MAGLLVLQDEAAPLGLQVNWTKTKIQHVGEPRLTQSTVQVAAENVDLVDEFIYLGSLISHDGGSEAEILRRIGISSASPSLRRTSGGLIYSQTRCTSSGPTYPSSPALWVRDMARQQDPGKAPRCLRHLVSAENFTDSVHQAHYK